MISGWMLPSPAWPTTGIAVSWRSAISSTPASRSGDARDRHADVLEQHAPRALDGAGSAIRRASHEQLALVGVVGRRSTSVAPAASQAAASPRSPRRARRPARRTGRAAARRRRGRGPSGVQSSTALIAARSISSSSDGRTGATISTDGRGRRRRRSGTWPRPWRPARRRRHAAAGSPGDRRRACPRSRRTAA